MISSSRNSTRSSSSIVPSLPLSALTYASLGENKPAPQEPAVPFALQVAPAVLGVGAALVFVLNTAGVFGEGPDLDELAASIEALGKV